MYNTLLTPTNVPDVWGPGAKAAKPSSGDIQACPCGLQILPFSADLDNRDGNAQVTYFSLVSLAAGYLKLLGPARFQIFNLVMHWSPVLPPSAADYSTSELDGDSPSPLSLSSSSLLAATNPPNLDHYETLAIFKWLEPVLFVHWQCNQNC